MAQLSYTENQARGFPGMKADTCYDYVRSYAQAEASAEIPFGVFVVKGSADQACVLPTTNAGKWLGVVLHSHVYDSTQLGDTGVKPKNMLSIDAHGTVLVKTEEAVVAEDRVFVRFASGAGGTQLGGVRKSADTGTAVELKGARFLESASAGSVVPIQLDANLIRSWQ